MTSKRSTKWTVADETTLREMYLAGNKPVAIADALGRTSKAVSIRLGLMRRDATLMAPAPSVAVPDPVFDLPTPIPLSFEPREEDAPSGFLIPTRALWFAGFFLSLIVAFYLGSVFNVYPN